MGLLATKLLIGVIVCMNALTCYYIIVVAKECYDKKKRTGKWL